jgi:hypothetical protein
VSHLAPDYSSNSKARFLQFIPTEPLKTTYERWRLIMKAMNAMNAITRRSTWIGIAMLLVLVGAAGPATAAVPTYQDGPQGLEPGEIIRRSLDHMAFRSRGAEMTMTMALIDAAGDRQLRTFHAKARKLDGRAHTLVRFLTPSDVAGTAFLFRQHPGEADRQHIYLPALRMVKRIAGQQKQARFMGSDFTYADLEWRDLRDARYKRHADTRVGRAKAYVIDSFPHAKDAYGRVRCWIRARDLVPLRLKFYDRRNKLLKVLYVKKVKRLRGVARRGRTAGGETLLITHLKMINRRTGHATEMVLSNIRLRNDLPRQAFSLRALRRGR